MIVEVLCSVAAYHAPSGRPYSLRKGQRVQLPDDLAYSLIKAGHAKRAQPKKAKRKAKSEG